MAREYAEPVIKSSTTRTGGLAAYGETALLESTNNGVYER